MERDHYAVVYNDGNLLRQDFKEECQKEGWLPIVVLRGNNEIVVPLFKEERVARRFIVRNFEGLECSLMTFINGELEEMKEKGWRIDFMDYPTKFTKNSGYELSFEIVTSRIEQINYE